MLSILNLFTHLIAWKEGQKEEGQTLVEYALIIAVVSIARSTYGSDPSLNRHPRGSNCSNSTGTVNPRIVRFPYRLKNPSK